VNLDLVVVRESPTLLRRHPLIEKVSTIAWHKAAFVLLWEGQSQVSTVAYLGLVAFGPLWLAFAVMLVWSLIATVFFCAARERGYPNLLTMNALPQPQVSAKAAWMVLGTVLRAWITGLNAFLFARASNAFLLEKEGCCRARRLARFGVLGVGLIFFGVTSAEHLLRTSGYQGRRLLQLSLIGPFLNVPYRVLLSAAFVALVTDALNLVTL
jgi:hypothetical protein